MSKSGELERLLELVEHYSAGPQGPEEHEEFMRDVEPRLDYFRALDEVATAFERRLFGIPFRGIPDEAWQPMTDATIAASDELGMELCADDEDSCQAYNEYQNNFLAEALELFAERIRNGKHYTVESTPCEANDYRCGPAE